MVRGTNRRRSATKRRTRNSPKRRSASPADRRLGALFGDACSLWRLDRREEAVRQFREVLRSDPDDRRFARYWLAAFLLDRQRHDELEVLLKRYEAPTAPWRYAQALFAFRSGGDTDDARRLLEEASRLDAGFLDYVLGDGIVYAERPIRFGPDRRESNHSLAALFLPAWRATPGAVTWVRRVLRVPLSAPPADLPFPGRQLDRLPARNVQWQVGLRRLDEDEPESGEDRGWILGIADLDRQAMLHVTVIEGDPTPEAAWRGMLASLLQPMEGEPHRPARVEVPRPEFVRAWQPLLAEIAVECAFEPDPQPITDMLGGMADLIESQRLPPLSEDLDPREFPQNDAVWQVDFFHLPTMISNEKIGVEQPWSALVVDKESGFVLSHKILRGEPTPEQLGEHLLRTMARPGSRDPVRPSKVELADSDCYDWLKPKLHELGVGCSLMDSLPELEDYCRQLASSYGEPERCALADGEGVTRDQMESFYHAAAAYFERAPWKHVAGEIPIEIRCRGLDVGTLYAIVLGRTGMTMGLALYRDWSELLATLRGLRSCEDMWGFSVIFDEVTLMAPVDLYLVERNGWPIRTPEAYPAVLRFEPGQYPEPPRSEELDYIESCLRVIPDFVTGKHEKRSYEVATNGRKIKMRLSWTMPRF